MRIRSTKPEFWRSGRVASVSWDARLVLKGLESYVDDNGVGKHEMALIVGDLFSRDLIREPSRTLARVSEAISELNQAGLLWLYDADGTDLLFVAFWDSIQRVDKPQSGRFPRPDGTMDYRESVIRESSTTPRESSRTVLSGTGEQGSREKERERRARDTLTLIPDNWQPNLTHHAKARSLGIEDINSAAEAFRNHALSEARQSANWDAAFASWLASPRTRATERDRNATKPQSKLRAAAELAQRMRDEETQAQRKELA